MKSIIEFESELSMTTKKLDPYWKLIRDEFPESEHTAVVELGNAIISLNKIRTRIYKLYPDLKPDGWIYDEKQSDEG